MLLTNISNEHTKHAGKTGPAEDFIMHPFETTIGKNVGKFELLRTISKPGQKPKNQSTHVIKSQFAEL